MKTNDFENAIEALGCNIEIIEMKTSGGQVKLCTGHIQQILIYWDVFGRAFALHDAADPMAIAEDIYDNMDLFSREAAYDLTFG